MSRSCHACPLHRSVMCAAVVACAVRGAADSIPLDSTLRACRIRGHPAAGIEVHHVARPHEGAVGCACVMACALVAAATVVVVVLLLLPVVVVVVMVVVVRRVSGEWL
jgi:hypothetical protein